MLPLIFEHSRFQPDGRKKNSTLLRELMNLEVKTDTVDPSAKRSSDNSPNEQTRQRKFPAAPETDPGFLLSDTNPATDYNDYSIENFESTVSVANDYIAEKASIKNDVESKLCMRKDESGELECVGKTEIEEEMPNQTKDDISGKARVKNMNKRKSCFSRNTTEKTFVSNTSNEINVSGKEDHGYFIQNDHNQKVFIKTTDETNEEALDKKTINKKLSWFRRKTAIGQKVSNDHAKEVSSRKKYRNAFTEQNDNTQKEAIIRENDTDKKVRIKSNEKERISAKSNSHDTKTSKFRKPTPEKQNPSVMPLTEQKPHSPDVPGLQMSTTPTPTPGTPISGALLLTTENPSVRNESDVCYRDASPIDREHKTAPLAVSEEDDIENFFDDQDVAIDAEIGDAEIDVADDNISSEPHTISAMMQDCNTARDVEQDTSAKHGDIDRGYAFVILFASFCLGLTGGVIDAFGVFYVELLDYFAESHSDTAWPGSMAYCFLFMAGKNQAGIIQKRVSQFSTIFKDSSKYIFQVTPIDAFFSTSIVPL